MVLNPSFLLHFGLKQKCLDILMEIEGHSYFLMYCIKDQMNPKEFMIEENSQ